MSKHETPMTLWYWERTGGTLILEFPAVRGGPHQGYRLIDAVIVPGDETRIARASEVTLEGKDIIVVQAKRGRLGMYLMGQAVFSRKLMEQFGPRSIRSVALCEMDDDVLGPLLRAADVEIVIYPEVDTAGNRRD